MDAPVRILAVAGSLREASYTRRLTRLAAALVPAGAQVVEFDELRAIEPFDEDLEADGTAPGAAAWKQAVREADALLVVTPEYNGSIPGQLKNAFDWASRADTPPFNSIAASPLYGKPVAVASASTGQFGGVWARDELIRSLKIQGARVLDEPKVAVAAAHEAFDETGALVHASTQRRLEELVATLDAHARMVRNAASTPVRSA